MDILSVAIIAFVVMEMVNLGVLYFYPGSRRANGMGVFNAYERSKLDPEARELVTYLVNWVAGTKLMFVALLIVILLTGSPATKAWAVVALILSILSFFWRLAPAIVRMDKDGQVTPQGYSRTLRVIIACFVGGLAAAPMVFLVSLPGS